MTFDQLRGRGSTSQPQIATQSSGNASCAASGDALRPGGCGIAGRGREGANKPSAVRCARFTQPPLRPEWLPEVQIRPIFKWSRLIQPRRIGMVAAGDGLCLRDFACCLAHHYPASLSLCHTSPAPMFHASPRVHIATLLVCADAWINERDARFYAVRPHDRLPHYGGRVGPCVCVWRTTTTTPSKKINGASVRA